MFKKINRRNFLGSSGVLMSSALLANLPDDKLFTLSANKPSAANTHATDKRIGIIGLDTSHSVAFTKALNGPQPDPAYTGFKIVAAYPKGSNDIESSVKRIAGYTEEVKKLGVTITGSIKELLGLCDFVLLETNDGRLHLEQVMEVFKAGKPVFIDKPVAGSLKDAVTIYKEAAKYKVPVFSSSSLRYMDSIRNLPKAGLGAVTGADSFSPAVYEKTHPDLFWYGVHGVEILFAVMGTGCKSVSRTHTDSTDIVVGTWSDGRIGTFRGTRTGTHDYGGTVYCEKGNLVLGPFKGYYNLLVEILQFFTTGKPPVSAQETIGIFAFMEAADESRRQGGKPIEVADVLKKPIIIDLS